MSKIDLNILTVIEAYTWALNNDDYNDIYQLTKSFCHKHTAILADVAVAVGDYIICYDELKLTDECSISEKIEAILFCYRIWGSENIVDFNAPKNQQFKNDALALFNYLNIVREVALREIEKKYYN